MSIAAKAKRPGQFVRLFMSKPLLFGQKTTALFLFGYRVIAAPAKRIAAKNAAHRQKRAFEKSKALDCLHRVAAAGRGKSAARAFHRGNPLLVPPYQCD